MSTKTIGTGAPKILPCQQTGTGAPKTWLPNSLFPEERCIQIDWLANYFSVFGLETFTMLIFPKH